MAARASLQRCSNEQILTPEAFYKFCVENITNISFAYSTNMDYEQEQKLLVERHARATTIAGTQKLHSFVPMSETTLMVKIFSESQICKTKKVANNKL